MADTPDISGTNHIEAQNGDFSPEKNPLMRPVIVHTEVPSVGGLDQQGWMTDIQGAKVDLYQVASHNIKKQTDGMGEYERIYFTTHSGTIYCARSLEDGAWELQSSNNPTLYTIRQPASLEVGQRFRSPHQIGGRPELDTSPVQNITVVTKHSKGRQFGYGFSKEETDIGTQFVQRVLARGGTLR